MRLRQWATAVTSACSAAALLVALGPASRPAAPVIPAEPAAVAAFGFRFEPDLERQTRTPEPRPTSSPVVVPVPTRAATGAHSLRGVASWFATGPDGLYAAAGPALRVGHWRGKIVKTCLSNSPATCVWVKLNDYCGCPGRLIDLSDQAFRRLAPLSVGLITVRVSW